MPIKDQDEISINLRFGDKCQRGQVFFFSGGEGGGMRARNSCSGNESPPRFILIEFDGVSLAFEGVSAFLIHHVNLLRSSTSQFFGPSSRSSLAGGAKIDNFLKTTLAGLTQGVVFY